MQTWVLELVRSWTAQWKRCRYFREYGSHAPRFPLCESYLVDCAHWWRGYELLGILRLDFLGWWLVYKRVNSGVRVILKKLVMNISMKGSRLAVAHAAARWQQSTSLQLEPLPMTFACCCGLGEYDWRDGNGGAENYENGQMMRDTVWHDELYCFLTEKKSSLVLKK